SGQPLSGVKVDVYNRLNQNVASGTTDSNGVFHPQIANALGDNSNAPYTAIASNDNVYGLASSEWGENFQPYNFKVQPDFNPKQDVVYLYTDQPVYRPSHPVYFRGIVRNQDDVTFTAPGGESVSVTITDAQGKQVFQQNMKLNGYAAFNGKYEPPADAALGNYSLEVQYREGTYDLNFEVAQFRPPEFLVNATAAAKEVVAGDTIKVGVDSSFYFGGPVSGGKVTWTAIANPGYFNYTGDGNYDFGTGYSGTYDFGPIRPTGQRQVGSGTGTLDDKGHFDISLPADLGGQDGTQSFTVEATVTDISNQSISGRTEITVHPAKLYVGLQPAAYVGNATKPLDVNVIAVDWASQPKPNTDVTLKVFERRWQQDPNTLQWTMKAIPVTDGKVTTDAKGRAVFTFTPPRAGIYAVDATARDDGERIAHTITTVWVSGPEFVPWNTQNNNLVLVADKKQYAPGDTASILIPSPFPEPVKALVTVERAGIMKTDVVTISGSYSYKLPIDVSYAPNVYVAVALMRGSGDKDVIPEVRYGLLNLPVTVQQQLKIKITPSTSTAKPGDTVKFDVTVTDLQGNPVAAEVGLSLSDLANLSVGTSNSEKILDFFWHQRGLSIQTSTSLARLIDGLTDKDARMVTIYPQAARAIPGSAPLEAAATSTGAMQAAGGAAPAPEAQNAAKAADGALKATDQLAQAPTPRTNFVDTPLWIPDLTTDASGHATTQVTLPDNLTTWRLDARGISQKTYVGDSSLDVVSTKPLLVRPSTPRFFVVGDQTELAVVVNNNSGKGLSVNVSLDSKGATLKGDAMQTVSLPKDGRTRVAWQATVQDVDNVDLTFKAVSADGEYSDASKPEVGLGDQRLLPVYRYLAPDYVSTAGTLTQPGTRTEAVIVPNATLAPTGELTINVQPSLAATTLDGLTYLENYPYQCVEQTVSRFLPNIITFRALQKLNLDKPALRANLDAAVQYALGRLQREQHPDGGLGWFPEDESNPLSSTYALLGLIEAKAADETVDADMFSRALTYVSSTLSTVNDNTPRYEMNRQAFTLYVLARAGAPNPADMDALFARREKTNLFARAFLAQAYHAIQGDQNKINTLLSDLQSAAVLSATGTHWEEGYRDWWNWDSDTRTTAIVLQTLVELTPKSDMIPNVVRWLMVARRGDAWESTQETAWAVMALTDWMDVSGELKANYVFDVSLNGKSVGSGKASSDTLRDTTTLKVAVADMLRDQVNMINIDHGDGAGNLYYTATLHVNQPVESIQPTNRGIGLSRTYLIDGKPVTSAKVGDMITVALEITANSDLYYVNIDDPIPAGTELLDTSLQTTTQIGQTPELTEIDPLRRGWGWWWFSNTELRTEKAVLSATYLPKGTYRFVYQVQATAAGTYRVIPPNGNEFYFPEVFGRGAGSLFTITS
ncbi:MAG TPA: alpha-2-macroglobulin family protein, partial [Aggregatilineales bacterium]|nr:alpha-2-macroglobulin family protein [Aggregatilineales bacterium]